MMTRELIAAFTFGVIFVITLLVLAVVFPEPSPFQYTVFRIVLALAAAGVAASLPGLIELTLHAWLKAGGAMAVFVIVFFFSPARLVSHRTAATSESAVVNDLNYLSKVGHGQVKHTDPMQEIQQLADWVQDVQQREISLRKASLDREFDAFIQALTQWSELKVSLKERYGADVERFAESDRLQIAECIDELYKQLFGLTNSIDEWLMKPG